MSTPATPPPPPRPKPPWVARAVRSTRRAAGATGRAAGATGRAAGATRRAAGRTFHGIRRLTHARGAGESGMARLLEMHAFSTAADAAVAVALAGTLFFQVPTGEARGQVALFLALTMLPFAIVAPLIGPFLDRYRRGRRWAIGGTTAIRGVLSLALVGSVETSSPGLFLSALGILVSSKAYGVTKSSAVPRVLPTGFTLVEGNSRLSLTGTVAAAVSAPIAIALAQIGPEWALRYAFVLFAIATALAVLLPAHVDSSAGEEQVEGSGLGSGRVARRAGVTSLVVAGLRCNAGLRFLSGFLVMYMAFLLRARPFPGWEDRTTILIGLVVGAAGLGNTVGIALAALLRARRPQVIVVVVLLVDVVMVVVAAVAYSLPIAMALGLTVGICQSLGKLSLDAVIQDEVKEFVRTSVFARAETLVQLSWVVGGFVGIALPLSMPRLSLGIAAALLLGWTAFVVRSLVLLRRQRSAPAPPEPAGPRGPTGPHAP